MDRLRVGGAFCFKVHGSEYMMVGLPDIVGVYKGLFFAFETKLPQSRDNTTPMQERVMAKIRKAGGLAQVVCTPGEAEQALLEGWNRKNRYAPVIHQVDNSRRSGMK
jgi:hypothetical protein